MGTASITFGVGVWGPSHHRQDQEMGDCLHAAWSGDTEPSTGAQEQKMGTLTSSMRSGCCNPCVGVGTILLGRGPGGHLHRDFGTSALASGLGELRAGTAAPPQGSAGWKQGTVGAGCVCPLPPHRGSDRGLDPVSLCLLQHHHPGGLRITQMWHRSCLTPS